MSLPERKRNRLQNYDYSQNGTSFITICTQNRAKVLSKITVKDDVPILILTQTGKIIDDFINEIPEKYPTAHIDKYIIMPDHIHILISLEEAAGGTGDPSPTVDRIFGWFKYQTTKTVNACNSTAGKKFWQRSFFDHVIRNEQDFAEIYQYIEFNPQRWIEKRNLHSKENEQCYIQAHGTRA